MQGDDDTHRQPEIEFPFPPCGPARIAQRLLNGQLRDHLVKGIEMQRLAELAFRTEITYAVLDRATPGNWLAGTISLP